MFIRGLFGRPDPYLCIKAEGFQGKAALLLCSQQPCAPSLRPRWGHQPAAPCQLSSSLWHHLPPASPGPPCSLLEQVWCAKIIQQPWTSHIPRVLQPPPGPFPTQPSALLCFSSIAGGEGFSTSFWHFRDATWYVNLTDIVIFATVVNKRCAFAQFLLSPGIITSPWRRPSGILHEEGQSSKGF